jgi:hypothetical protein
MKPEITFLILGVLLVAVYLYYSQYKEGFISPAEQKRIDARKAEKERMLAAQRAKLPTQAAKQAPIAKPAAPVAPKAAPAPLPTAAQTSAIPKATPGATTTDPTKALAQPKDIEALMEVLKNYGLLATQKNPDSTDLGTEDKSKALYFLMMLEPLNNELQAALAKSDAAEITQNDATILRNEISRLTDKLRAARVISPSAGTMIQTPIKEPSGTKDAEYAKLVEAEPMPTVAAGPVGVISLQTLEQLLVRVKAEGLRLSNLRSTAATTQSRIAHLEKLAADLGDIITAVKRKTMKLEDVPITPDAAQRFLKELQSNTGPIPPLIVPKGVSPASIKASPTVSQFDGTPLDNAMVQKMLEEARNLKWSLDVRLEYDPHMKQREEMLERIEKITKNLTLMSVSDKAMTPAAYQRMVQEMSTIQRHAMAQPPQRGPPVEGSMSRLRTDYARVPTGAPTPSADQVYAAQGAGLGTQPNMFPHGEISPDIQIRPGFVMNTDQIARRPSAASFDGSAVGGPDYKTRALELCRQVKSAQLGDANSFGCVSNPDAVGPNYSWKGNFTMVCNRLGDSWGRSYPEQFGCPKYDPTAKFSSGF